MHPAFATIRFGPFATDYHRRTVDERFRRRLSAYLETHLLPQVDEPFDATEGTLTAEVGEERFCGPNSLVRDVYRLEFAFVRPGWSDTVKAQVRYHPATGSFATRYRHGSLVLWTRKRGEADRAFRGAIDDIVSEVRAGAAGQWRCPNCGDLLRPSNTPSLFDLTPRGCFTYSVHLDPQTGGMRSGHYFSNFFEATSDS